VATLTFNIAKGRVAELHNRVKVGDPAAARLYVIPISRGAVTDAQLVDADDFAAIVTLGVTERTTNGWNRKTLAAADLSVINNDDTNDRMALDSGDFTWTGVALAGGAITDLVICYASVGSPTNAQLLPMTNHDFAITPDGSDVVATVADYFRAT
jgi:hypothetical protein